MLQPRRTPQALAKLLEASSYPIYVLDEDRHVVFCNAACAEWVGLDAAELIGACCQYHSEPGLAGPSAVAARLCPPPAVFSGVREIADVSSIAADGRLVRRRGEFLPLAEGADASAAVLAILDAHDCEDEAADAPADPPLPRELHAELERYRHEWAGRYQLDRLVGDSPAIVRARAQIVVAAATTASVLIVGPQGSGKNHVAKAIHYCALGIVSARAFESPRRSEPSRKGAGGESAEAGGSRPLVPLDCAVLTPDVLISALSAAVSKLTASDGGATLLLRDVDHLSAEMYADVGRLLKNCPATVRVLATAARPLEELARQDRFPAELAYQLSTLVIELPPLVERLADLPLLAQVFLESANAKSGKQIGGFSADALDRLSGYQWPANLDELAEAVRQSHARCQSTLIEAADLPERLQLAAQAARYPRRDEAIVLEDFLARVETELIQRALRRAKGNKSKAAKLLGLTRPRLYRRLIQLGLEVETGK